MFNARILQREVMLNMRRLIIPSILLLDITLILFIAQIWGVGISSAFVNFMAPDAGVLFLSAVALLVLMNLVIRVRHHLSNFQITFFTLASIIYSIATLIMIFTFKAI
jgi:hypothetical protein